MDVQVLAYNECRAYLNLGGTADYIRPKHNRDIMFRTFLCLKGKDEE